MPNHLLVFSDGGARGNPGQAAIGVIIKSENGKVLAKISKHIGLTTNNGAEYQALIAALTYLSENSQFLSLIPESTIDFFLDSNLIVNQVNGFYKVKNGNLRQYLLKIRELELTIPAKIYYQLIPREKNSEADQLVNLALNNQRY